MKTGAIKATIALAVLPIAALLLASCGRQMPADRPEDIPIVQTPPTAVVTPTDIGVDDKKELISGIAHTADGLGAFAFSLSEFISAYNSACEKYGGSVAAAPSENWLRFENENSPCLGRRGCLFQFSEDTSIWSLPTISVYAESENDNINEIMLIFDDHSLQESMYDDFEDISKTTLAALLPKLSHDDVARLYADVYDHAYDNYFGVRDFWPPDKVTITGDVALYGYYGMGTINICLLPASDGLKQSLSQSGTQISTF